MAIDVSPLFQPLTINDLTLPNRFVMPGMQRSWGIEGQVSDKTINYYRERAEGGTGLIITEALGVDHPAASLEVGELHLNAATRDGWARCVEVVKGAGGNFLLQLWHPGAVRKEGQGLRPEVPPISPSGEFAGKPHGRAASAQDLEDLKAAWVQAAVTARDIGADGVEIHMAHGYLLHQFLWSESNRREDHYGGEAMADRVRFPAEIVAAVRDAVGGRFVISCRISQWAEWDYEAKVARTPEELETMIIALRRAGADVFHMSKRYFHKPEWPDSPLPLAGWVKTVTDAPVITVGSVGLDVDLMQTLYSDRPERQTLTSSLGELAVRFERGEFDLVAVGRSIIADPEFVNKLRDGRFDEIRPFTRADLADVLDNLDDDDVPEEIKNLAKQEAATA
jgi:2,4-dienoyl-CoA reductase-like NADH-dependent reductase (Old Yellow Enzyme family)